MSITNIISLFAGIAFFLYGMSSMGDGLKRISGNKLEPVLYKLSGTPIRGFLLGSGVTAVIQSSSATSVIVVGFTDSGMLKLKQAIPIILGAIFGTSITGWVVCLSYIEGAGQLGQILSTATLTGVVALIGIILKTFGKKKVHRDIGELLMGFAILMMGMSTMSGSVSGLKDQPWFNSLMTSMRNPVLGILLGFGVSALLQSASAAVGIVQALSVTGAASFESVLPMLMGISVGAALPVLLTALGTNLNGRRTALSYLASTFMGVLICASLFYIISAVVEFPFLDLVMNPFSIALLNTVFRLIMVLILIPLTDVIEAVVCHILPDKQEKEDPLQMNEQFIRHPILAIEQCRQRISDMAMQSMESVIEAGALISRYSEPAFEKVVELEQAGDHYEDVLGSFLMKLSEQDLTEAQGRESTIFLHTIPDFERISDHARNVAESAKEIYDKRMNLSEEVMHELSVLMAAVREILSMATEAFANKDIVVAEKIEPLEEVIDGLCEQMKMQHVKRLQHGKCSIEQGFVFNDLLTDYERISDHCSNVAAAIIEIYAGSFATHEYLDMLKLNHDRSFDKYYEEYRKKFVI